MLSTSNTQAHGACVLSMPVGVPPLGGALHPAKVGTPTPARGRATRRPYFFLVSRKRGDSANVKITTSSPDAVLMS